MLRMLANRLQKVLPFIVSESQLAFVKGRVMIDNVMLVQELFVGYERKNILARCMDKIDLRKAYDTVEWGFISELLLALNFPPNFSSQTSGMSHFSGIFYFCEW